jgi:hypothetical protein
MKRLSSMTCVTSWLKDEWRNSQWLGWYSRGERAPSCSRLIGLSSMRLRKPWGCFSANRTPDIRCKAGFAACIPCE